MPPRDDSDFEQRRQQIIDGALVVFARDGFEKATNKDIARAAGIGSAGLIYHYFKDKADLLQQAVTERATVLQALDWTLSNLESQPPRETLRSFLKLITHVVDNPIALRIFRVVMSEAIRRPHVAALMNEIGPVRAIPILSAYLSGLMDQGVLRRSDPAAAARTLMGPMIAYLLTREVFQQPDALALSSDQMIDTALDIFWRGMAVDPAA